MSTNQEQSVNQAANQVLLKLELCLALKIHLDEEYFFEEVWSLSKFPDFVLLE